MSPPSSLNCLPGIYLHNLLGATRNATNELRSLRVALSVCPLCPDLGRCPHRATMNAMINQAVTELTEEWNLCLP